MKYRKEYTSPEVEIVEAVVEAGFQESNLEDPIVDETQSWSVSAWY